MAYLLHDRHIMMPRESPEETTDLRLLGERYTGSKQAAEHWADFVSTSCGVRALRRPDARFCDGDVLDFGPVRLQAIHAPGHVDDHYCFLDLTSGTLLTTDIDLTSFGPWYGNPESDIERFQESVQEVMSLPYTRVCSSHRAPVESQATEVLRQFLDGFKRQRQAVLEQCRQPATLDRIAASSLFYGDGLPDKVLQRLFEYNMSAKIVSLLVRDGLLEESAGRYRCVSDEASR